jgi:DNA-binding MarR family transcriptional regulator
MQKKPLSVEPIQFAKIQCACTNLKMAARTVGRAYDVALASLDLNTTQYAILVNIERYQPIPQMQLASHLKLERTTLYRAVDLLKRKKWLFTTGVNDGVSHALQLTPLGQQTIRAAKIAWEKVQAEFIRSFGHQRWAEFLSTLEEIQDYFIQHKLR